ncbi:DNA oxidative demethylase ALKBH2 [Sphaerodactylus townsendi]|uniref:Alpha-ketoglutarate-dependent dioxygenase alkB 2 n=1 Tax=Sphaerodactylus townsendi TaxID=933632 RepID=A0ACB8FZN4_9SAUR|nr:DNA oxidative demethylase ALKBH2 [Sphaerodactylus townsendi]
MDKFLVRGTPKLTSEKRQHQPEEGDGDCTEDKDGTEEERPRRPVALPDEPHKRRATPWREIRAQGLNCSYTILFGKNEADRLFQELEKEIEYFEGEFTKLQVFGKWHSIPRKQVTYGDSGLTYTYSGVTFSPKPWIPVLEHIRDKIQLTTGHTFNFVLINRYKDGHDHIGEHRDDEQELVPRSPIASVSLGACRDFVFRHGASRGKRTSCHIEPIRLQLEHGSLLMMNFPTNRYWYHSLPIRKKTVAPRINLTFRKLMAL